jgi:hypothetical protein
MKPPIGSSAVSGMALTLTPVWPASDVDADIEAFMQRVCAPDEFVRIHIPDTQCLILVPRSRSSPMLWEPRNRRIWRVDGFGEWWAARSLDRIEPQSRRVSVYWGNQDYGERWGFDFRDAEAGLTVTCGRWAHE